MGDELPNEFDLIVVGTGLCESIVAAAASRIGKTVLHIDPNEFYGNSWASFNLEAFQNFIDCASKLTTCDIQYATQTWHISDDEIKDSVESVADSDEKKAEDALPKDGESEKCESVEAEANLMWTKDKILKEFRKFNIDLCPKLLFACGRLVKLLISSNICRYAEFRAVDKICTVIGDQIKNVPCSRSDVFNTKDVSIVEKRLLMKVLTSCMSYDEHPEQFSDFEGKTFLEYLKGSNLTDNLIHYVLYSISMSSKKTPLKEGIENTKKFLSSLGRYGNTPFLFPMYGCGEIPQCFCRLCAVFGGIYCLKKTIDNLECTTVDGVSRLVSVNCSNQKIKAQYLVASSTNIPDKCKGDPQTGGVEKPNKTCGNISRAVYITSKPLGNAEINSGGGGVNLFKMPAEEPSLGAFVLQLSHYSGTCPKGLYIIHIICESGTGDAKSDVSTYENALFNLEDSPKMLYSAYFKIPNCKSCSAPPKADSGCQNVVMVCNPFLELDYDLSIENAETVFKQIYPNEEFLPRAPDPEEIVMDDEDPEAVRNDELINIDIQERVREIQEGLENELNLAEENIENERKEVAEQNQES